jgi:hypothetical protein
VHVCVWGGGKIQDLMPSAYKLQHQNVTQYSCSAHCLPAVCLSLSCRLALARVSVLRGSGPAAGSAFIDDYVACVEPVVDYLTRWSGIRPGKHHYAHKQVEGSVCVLVLCISVCVTCLNGAAYDQVRALQSQEILLLRVYVCELWPVWSLLLSASHGGAAYSQVTALLYMVQI